MSNHTSLPHIVPPIGCSTDQSFSLFPGKKRGSDQSRAYVGLLLFSPTKGMHISRSPLSPPPLLSFITQLSFVGLIRLYLVWVHWGENFWGSMWKGKEKGGAFRRSHRRFGSRTIRSKCLTCTPWQWQIRRPRELSAAAFNFLLVSLCADVPLTIALGSTQWLQMLCDVTNVVLDAHCSFIFTLTRCWNAHSSQMVNVCAVIHCLQLLTEPDQRIFGLHTIMF